MDDDSGERFSSSRTASADRPPVPRDDDTAPNRIYLSDMVGQLHAMALSQGLVVAAALLNLARAEVDAHIGSRGTSRRRSYRRVLKK